MKSHSEAVTGATLRYAKLIIIGSGFGGLATAIRTKQSGSDDFLLLERAGEVGGVWRDNSYPGCACDVQSHLYSFSFAPNPGWTRDFSQQAEIHAYLKRCAEDFGITPHLRCDTTVQGMDWLEAEGEWRIATTQGEYRARYVVLGMGSLSDPLIPHLQGIETFQGRAFHSANWPKDLSLKGKRVAVIGTGASATQFIPAIQPELAQLTVYQRTPAWVMPRHDALISPRRQNLFRRLPWMQRLTRAFIYVQRELTAFGFRNPPVMRLAQRTAVKHLHRAVQDPQLRQKLTPDYTLGCKRILISNTYYPALAKDNVEVVTAGVARVTATGLIGVDGVERAADVIIYGAGFKVQDLPYSHYVRGTEGQTLAQAWRGSPKALAGTSVNGFPNLFLLHGPNVGLGHTSVIYMLEAQVEHAISAMRHTEEQKKTTIEARQQSQQRFTNWIDRQLRGTVWTAGGCSSWYLDATGRNSAIWPSYTFRFRAQVARIRPKDYELRLATAALSTAHK